MPALRTEITEVITGLAMFGYPDIRHALSVEPPAFHNVGRDTYARLREEFAAGRSDGLFHRSWENGVRFARSEEALRRRSPWMIEWKGPHRPPGYDRIPADLRVDHVFLVSCKFGSNILMNSSPSNLFDRLLADRRDQPGDWYQEIAAHSYQRLYSACRGMIDAPLPESVTDLDPADRETLKRGLPRTLSGHAQSAYLEFVSDVATSSAERWRVRMGTGTTAESTVWRLLRLESAPYYVLGESGSGDPIGYRVVTPGDLRRTHKFRKLAVRAETTRGQPIVSWDAVFTHRRSGAEVVVAGHVEVRWSHGKFAQVPEAKVYLDSPHHLVPGYVPLDEPADSSARLF
jgi:hypothetical protein